MCGGRFGVAPQNGWNRRAILRHYGRKGCHPFCHICARSLSETGGYSPDIAPARGNPQDGQTMIRSVRDVASPAASESVQILSGRGIRVPPGDQCQCCLRYTSGLPQRPSSGHKCCQFNQNDREQESLQTLTRATSVRSYLKQSFAGPVAQSLACVDERLN